MSRYQDFQILKKEGLTVVKDLPDNKYVVKRWDNGGFVEYSGVYVEEGKIKQV